MPETAECFYVAEPLAENRDVQLMDAIVATCDAGDAVLAGIGADLLAARESYLPRILVCPRAERPQQPNQVRFESVY